EPGRSIVAIQLARRVEPQRGGAVGVALVHRLRQRVRPFERDAVRHALVERDLHRVVTRLQTLSPRPDWEDASERRVRTAGVSEAERLRRVDVETRIAVDALRP